MKYAKYVFLVLVVVVLAACSNGISASNNNPGGSFNLLDLDGDGVPDVDQRPLIRAYFYEVHSASVNRRPVAIPMLSDANMIACRQDDATGCVPPVYKESVHVSISGSGTANTNDNIVRPQYLQSLSVEFTLEVEGSRRCLDQAIDAIEKKSALKISGLGIVYDAYANSGGGSVGGGTGVAVPEELRPTGTTSDDLTIAPPNPPDRPIWAGYQYAIFDALKECAAETSTDPRPEPLPRPQPTDPVQPQPANPIAD